MNTINERIDALREALGIKSTRKFDAAIDRALGTTWKITGNLQQEPGFGYLETIKKTFPHVDGNWLLSGEGEMFYPEKLRREYVENLERRLEIRDRDARRLETAMDMAANRRESNFQRLSKRTPAREIVVLFAKNTAKSA